MNRDSKVAKVFALALSGVALTWLVSQSIALTTGQDLDVGKKIDLDCFAQAPLSTCSAGPIVPNKSLFINDLCVVEDPCRTRWDMCHTCADPADCGAWTFGKLMTSMAGFAHIDDDPVAVTKFIEDWVKQFDQFTVVENGIAVPPRPGVFQTLIDQWWQISPDDHLDLRLAPFRLLSIVNRVDLRNDGFYSDSLAGEGRFIFGMLNINPAVKDPSAWNALRGTVILEYDLPAKSCDETIEWGHHWRSLSDIPFGEDFNAALQSITDNFAGFGAGGPGKPNMSAINQVRTNEVLGGPWELREFQLVGSGAVNVPLVQTTVAQTVDDNFNHQPAGGLLEQYIAADQLAIVNHQHEIPLFFNGQPFRAGASQVVNPIGIWETPTFECTETRHNFAINNCNGCHAAEAGLFDCQGGLNFTHVDIREMGQKSSLSRFLTGDQFGVEDLSCPPAPHPNSHGCFSPATEINDGATIRYMNDLQRRSMDLCHLLNNKCDIVIKLELQAAPGLDEKSEPVEKEVLDIFTSEHSAGPRVH